MLISRFSPPWAKGWVFQNQKRHKSRYEAVMIGRNVTHPVKLQELFIKASETYVLSLISFLQHAEV